MKKILGLFAIAIVVIAVWNIAGDNPEKPVSEDQEVQLGAGLEKSSLTQNSSGKPQNENLRVKNALVPAEKQVDASIPEESVAVDLQRKGPVTKVSQELLAEQERIATEGYGTFPVVDLNDMNAHKQHVLDALQDPQNNSGSISITGKREKFDLAKYNSDPSYYIDTVEPGRAFDIAQPEEGVKPLARLGSNYHEAIQNEAVSLEARGEPNMPVSFTAFDGGTFQNGLGFITLKANGSGVASAEFTPTSGVIALCRIRAASPVNSGTLQWLVNAHLPTQD